MGAVMQLDRRTSHTIAIYIVLTVILGKISRDLAVCMIAKCGCQKVSKIAYFYLYFDEVIDEIQEDNCILAW